MVDEMPEFRQSIWGSCETNSSQNLPRAMVFEFQQVRVGSLFGPYSLEVPEGA